MRSFEAIKSGCKFRRFLRLTHWISQLDEDFGLSWVKIVADLVQI